MIPATMELLEPFFLHAEVGWYELAPATDELVKESLTALRAVFGSKAVKRVVLVSLAVPIPKPDWMTQAAYEASLRASLFYFSDFTLTGDRPGVERLTPFIKLLPRAIPLGEKTDEPGVWLVLVA